MSAIPAEDDDDVRAGFEAWATEHEFDADEVKRDGWGYADQFVDAAWSGWIAHCNIAAAPQSGEVIPDASPTDARVVPREPTHQMLNAVDSVPGVKAVNAVLVLHQVRTGTSLDLGESVAADIWRAMWDAAQCTAAAAPSRHGVPATPPDAAATPPCATCGGSVPLATHNRYMTEMYRKLIDAERRTEALDARTIEAALTFYRDEAEALARHLAKNGAASQAVLASVTVLALDGGLRAAAAIRALSPPQIDGEGK